MNIQNRESAFLCVSVPLCLKQQGSTAFSRIKLIIAFFSSVAFGVYVWHMQPLFSERVGYCFDFISNYHPSVSVVLICALSILMYLVISVLEYLRIRLFKLLKVKELAERAFTWMEVEP